MSGQHFSLTITTVIQEQQRKNFKNAIANYAQSVSFVLSWSLRCDQQSWLITVMKSKVEWFMAPIGWLMTFCSSPSYISAKSKRKEAADQSINHITPTPLWQLWSIERTFFSCSLITFEMITVIVTSKCKGLHLYSILSIFHSVGASMPKAKDSLCAGASV